MGYLLTEIVVYLVIAGLIGFAFGWAVRDGVLDKYFNKLIALMKKLWSVIKGFFGKLKPYYLTLTTSKKVVKKETKEEVSETVAEVIEVAKVEAEVVVATDTVETPVETSEQPMLLSEAPKEGKDKLSSFKGVGPALEKKLNALGVYTFEQIASWDAEQEVWIGTKLGFPKRVRKEEWVKQAKELLKNQ